MLLCSLSTARPGSAARSQSTWLGGILHVRKVVRVSILALALEPSSLPLLHLIQLP